MPDNQSLLASQDIGRTVRAQIALRRSAKGGKVMSKGTSGGTRTHTDLSAKRILNPVESEGQDDGNNNGSVASEHRSVKAADGAVTLGSRAEESATVKVTLTFTLTVDRHGDTDAELADRYACMGQFYPELLITYADRCVSEAKVVDKARPLLEAIHAKAKSVRKSAEQRAALARRMHEGSERLLRVGGYREAANRLFAAFERGVKR